MDKTFLIGLIAVVIAPLLGYVAANRRLSGKIGTSEATDLWAESSAIRADYREQIASSTRRTYSLEERVANLEKLNNELSRENMGLSEKSRTYEAVVDELRKRIAVLETQNADLRKLVAALQESLGREKP